MLIHKAIIKLIPAALIAIIPAIGISYRVVSTRNTHLSSVGSPIEKIKIFNAKLAIRNNRKIKRVIKTINMI